MVTLPAGNVFGIPAGTYGTMAPDGLYLTLAPLSANRQTICFTDGLAVRCP